jgi:AcrR family transcriptional regulator
MGVPLLRPVELRLVESHEELEAEEAPSARRTPQRVRIADAAMRCIARTGVSKTTLDDVAREAGCSRATVYRTFPGGKEEVIAAAVDTEVARFFSAIAVEMGQAEDLEDAVVAGMVATARAIENHPALQYVLTYEPGVLLPHLCFARMDGVLEVASRFTGAFLARWLDRDAARRVADLSARIVVSYIASPAPGVDIRDEDSARRLVSTFVMPGARKLAHEPDTQDSSGAPNELSNRRRK